MTASMLDEVEGPEKKARLWICVCCKFSFAKLDAYADHLIEMRKKVDAQLAEVKRG